MKVFRFKISIFAAILCAIVTIGVNFVFKFLDKNYFYKHYLPQNEVRPLEPKTETNKKDYFYLSIEPPEKKTFFIQSYDSEYLKQSLIKNGLSPETAIILRDEKYSLVDAQWFDSYADWWANFLEKNYISFENDTFDCDNFSDLFMVIFGLSNTTSIYKSNAQLACATIIVNNVYSFAGIPAQEDSWHSLNLVWTSSSWFVIEPQNGVYISLDSYPNKKHIKAVIF
jgi:hypothetical protein